MISMAPMPMRSRLIIVIHAPMNSMEQTIWLRSTPVNFLNFFKHGHLRIQGPIFSLLSFGVKTLKHWWAVVACGVPVRREVLRS